MAQEQRIVRFSGDVQGVGFRYTACRIAVGYAVGGYVRNLPDGGVECVVEGCPAEIDAFLDDVSRSMRAYIRGQTQQAAPTAGGFDSFSVRF